MLNVPQRPVRGLAKCSAQMIVSYPRSSCSPAPSAPHTHTRSGCHLAFEHHPATALAALRHKIVVVVCMHHKHSQPHKFLHIPKHSHRCSRMIVMVQQAWCLFVFVIPYGACLKPYVASSMRCTRYYCYYCCSTHCTTIMALQGQQRIISLCIHHWGTYNALISVRGNCTFTTSPPVCFSPHHHTPLSLSLSLSLSSPHPNTEPAAGRGADPEAACSCPGRSCGQPGHCVPCPGC